MLRELAVFTMQKLKLYTQAANLQFMASSQNSTRRLCLGKGPLAVQDFGARPIEAHRVVPVRHGR